MLNWVRCGGGCGALAQNAVMLVGRQECLRQSDLDSCVFLLVGPKSSRLIFRIFPLASETGQKLPAVIFLSSFLSFLPSVELRNLWPLVEKNADWEEGVILRKASPDVSVQKQTGDSLPGQNHTSHRTLRKKHTRVCVYVLCRRYINMKHSWWIESHVLQAGVEHLGTQRRKVKTSWWFFPRREVSKSPWAWSQSYSPAPAPSGSPPPSS